MSEAPLHILMVTPEAVPFAKTGGLADVTGALSLALARLGHRVSLVLPRYVFPSRGKDSFRDLQPLKTLAVPAAAATVSVTIEHGTLRQRQTDPPVEVYAIRYDPFFARDKLYGDPDDLERFGLLSRAALELILAQSDPPTDILHAHDWPAALSCVYRRALYADRPAMQALRTVFTIHNLGYQGQFPSTDFVKTGLPWDLFTPAGLEFWGNVNLLKGGVVFGDLLTTVSPTYSREIQEPDLGFGLEGVISTRKDDLVGIVNGIDVDEWNPATDPHLPFRYSADDRSGKRACKAALQQEMGLAVADRPLFGLVSRLVSQKGVDLLADILPDLMAMDLQLVILGTGEEELERRFRAAHQEYPGKFGLAVGFDEGLAHRIEAGVDIFLVPSRYEPCGLTQMISQRYGTVPIVRRTGGLADTVVPYDAGTKANRPATGLAFEAPTAAALRQAILRALEVYRMPTEWAALVTAAMKTDVSWERSAQKYVEVYRRLLRSK